MTDKIFLLDTEATNKTPFSGVMTEFGVVEFSTREWFHGVLHQSMPSKENPAIPVLTGIGGPTTATGPASMHVSTLAPLNASSVEVFTRLVEFIEGFDPSRAVFMSDNPGFDFMFFAYHCDEAGVDNPFGHSSRRIGDLAAGLSGNWRRTSAWKRYRHTKHTHHPVDDAMGNAEALHRVLVDAKQIKD